MAAALHPPSLAVVEGPAGVGKTRLVTELGRHPKLQDRRVLFGRCHDLREPLPLEPLIDAFRRAGPALSGNDPPPAGR